MEFSPMPNVSAAPSEQTVQISPPTVSLRPPNPLARPVEPPARQAASYNGARWQWFLSGSGAAVVLLGSAWFLGSQLGWLGHETREELPPESAASRDAETIAITAEPISFRTVRRLIEAVGTMHAYEEVIISPKVEGRIVKIHCDVADRVKPGEVMFELDPTDHELSVRQARQSLQVELAKLGLDQLPSPTFDVSKLPAVAQAEARLARAAARYERSLASKQSVSAEDLAERASEHRVAEAERDIQVFTAKAGLATIHSRQEALAVAQQQLTETVIRAPTPTKAIPNETDRGVYAVSMRAVAEGSFVRPGAEAFRLVIDQTLELRAAVPEVSGSEVKLGQTADVFVGGRTKPVAGIVTRINPVIDPATRTFEVEIQIDNSRGELKPGGFAKTAIHVRDDEAAVIPLEAVVKFAGITKIFLVREARAKEVQVTLGIQGDTWVEVESPVLPRDGQVVTSGQTVLADGAAIEVRGAVKKNTNR